MIDRAPHFYEDLQRYEQLFRAILIDLKDRFHLPKGIESMSLQEIIKKFYILITTSILGEGKTTNN